GPLRRPRRFPYTTLFRSTTPQASSRLRESQHGGHSATAPTGREQLTTSRHRAQRRITGLPPPRPGRRRRPRLPGLQDPCVSTGACGSPPPRPVTFPVL